MMRKLFGTDGIRGRANSYPITPDIAMKVGMAVGTILKQQAGKDVNEPLRVVIGKDTRLSCYMLENALVSGFTAVAADVFLLGPIPTPAVAMLCRSMRADVGVMVSASHNPYYDNGIKLFCPDGYKFSDELELKIERLMQSDLTKYFAKDEYIGRTRRVSGDIYRYIEFAKRTLGNISLSGLRIVVDCANGAGYKAAPCALWELGAEVITINDQPNGLNINQGCGSTNLDSLIKKVKETRADMGMALDGDADRVVMVDENGHIVDGDQLLAIIVRKWMEEQKLRGGGVVATIMSNLGLERFLNGKGLDLIRTQVGDRYVVEYMRKNGYNVGGEQSGHVVLSDFATTGDGLIAALQVIGYAKEQQKTLSQLAHQFEKVPQYYKNIPIINKNIINNEKVKQVIKEAEAKLHNIGRLVIRPSGTEPLIRIMGEGDDRDLIKTIIDNLEDVIKSNNLNKN
ncbi:phosphoglucosamine mutase [Bartonella sp. DGB1]|uniref:phosphoglucosamine mutase n=1 Tax=Bartonella sp. DGB1 TaxID=3239807 RepID=UPI0035233184